MPTKALLMHDVNDPDLSHNQPLWADLAGAFEIPFIYKVGGVVENGFVQYGPEHTIPQKFVCVMTAPEAAAAGITTTLLTEYTHPVDATYVFGPDNAERGWEAAFAGPDTDYISIVTPGATEMYSFMAAAMVIGHRWVVTGS